MAVPSSKAGMRFIDTEAGVIIVSTKHRVLPQSGFASLFLSPVNTANRLLAFIHLVLRLIFAWQRA